MSRMEHKFLTGGGMKNEVSIGELLWVSGRAGHGVPNCLKPLGVLQAAFHLERRPFKFTMVQSFPGEKRSPGRSSLLRNVQHTFQICGDTNLSRHSDRPLKARVTNKHRQRPQQVIGAHHAFTHLTDMWLTLTPLYDLARWHLLQPGLALGGSEQMGPISQGPLSTLLRSPWVHTPCDFSQAGTLFPAPGGPEAHKCQDPGSGDLAGASKMLWGFPAEKTTQTQFMSHPTSLFQLPGLGIWDPSAVLSLSWGTYLRRKPQPGVKPPRFPSWSCKLSRLLRNFNSEHGYSVAALVTIVCCPAEKIMSEVQV